MLNSCVLYYSYGVIFLVFSQSLWVWIILFVGALIIQQNLISLFLFYFDIIFKKKSKL